jgi:DNA-binding transcriptional ArsR family regulator
MTSARLPSPSSTRSSKRSTRDAALDARRLASLAHDRGSAPPLPEQAANVSTSVKMFPVPVAGSCDLLCLDLEQAEAIRNSGLEPSATRAAAQRARALGDPTRLTLAAALARADELCVCDLAWIAERSQNLVSHHLRTLTAAGLVESRRDGKMVMYALTTGGRALLLSVLEGEGQAIA